MFCKRPLTPAAPAGPGFSSASASLRPPQSLALWAKVPALLEGTAPVSFCSPSSLILFPPQHENPPNTKSSSAFLSSPRGAVSLSFVVCLGYSEISRTGKRNSPDY